MSDFSFDAHRTVGDSTVAVGWIAASRLPAEQKVHLQRFVDAFPSLGFFKEDDGLLDHLEEADQVTLPTGLREVRKTVAFVEPPMLVRVDDYRYLTPRSDIVEKVWYDIRLGYADEEQRELFHDEAGLYPIGSWRGTNRSYLAVDLQDPDDERVFECASQDLIDNSIDGRPVRDSVYPIFDSYAEMLAHIVEGRRPDGTAVEAHY